MFKPRSVRIVDPGLMEVGGHNHTQDLAIARECQKRGIPVTVYCRCGANLGVTDITMVELLRLDIFSEVVRPRIQEFAIFESFFLINRIFLQDLNSMPNWDLSPGDLVYFPNMTQNQIEAVIDWVIGLPVDKRPQIAITLRYLNSQMLYTLNRGHGPATELLYSHVLPKLFERHPHTHLFTDTQVLSENYQRLSGMPVITLPIPQLKPGPTRESNHRVETDGLNLLYIGGWAHYHGTDFLPSILENILSEYTDVKFTVHIKAEQTSEDMRAMVALSEAFAPRVHLLVGNLTPDEYVSTMQAADIVLLFYMPTHYSFASSGVFTEAAALGKVLAVTAGTTMETSINDYGLGAVIAQEFTAESCTATVKEVILNFAELDQKANASQARFSRENSPEGFLDKMFSCIR